MIDPRTCTRSRANWKISDGSPDCLARGSSRTRVRMEIEFEIKADLFCSLVFPVAGWSDIIVRTRIPVWLSIFQVFQYGHLGQPSHCTIFQVWFPGFSSFSSALRLPFIALWSSLKDPSPVLSADILHWSPHFPLNCRNYYQSSTGRSVKICCSVDTVTWDCTQTEIATGDTCY